jgi:hypothetical protein
MVEQGTHNPLVAGSNPAGPTRMLIVAVAWGRPDWVSLREQGATRIETGEWMGKSVLVGAILALVLVAVLGAGGYLYSRSVGGITDIRPQDRVVLIFESPAEDGATVAALITVVADGRMRDVSPDTKVTIPGTSYTRLGDAFVFGGGAAVARALGNSRQGGRVAFVSVPESEWRAAIEASRGVEVNVRDKVTVFDGQKLTTIPAGKQKLSADSVAALLRGLSYVSPTQSQIVRRELERQLASALASRPPSAELLDSSLSPAALGLWLQKSLSQAAIAQVD